MWLLLKLMILSIYSTSVSIPFWVWGSASFNKPTESSIDDWCLKISFFQHKHTLQHSNWKILKFSAMLFSGSYCLGCRVQCSSSSLADSLDRLKQRPVCNKPVWTKLKELPDSLRPKKLESIYYIYIISWTIQLSWISFNLLVKPSQVQGWNR